MKAKVLILFFSFACQYSFSNGKFDYVFSNHNWKLGLGVSPALNRGSMHNLSNNGNLDYKLFLGFSTGAHYSKRIAKTTFIEAGILYSVAGVRYSREPTFNFELDFEAKKEVVTNRFEQISIPLKVHFYKSNYRRRKFVSLGASLNTQIRQTQYQSLYLPENTITTNVYKMNERYTRMGGSLYFGLGIEHDIEQDLSISTEPFLGLSVFPGKDLASVFSLGINVKIQIQGL